MNEHILEIGKFLSAFGMGYFLGVLPYVKQKRQTKLIEFMGDKN